MVDLSTARWKKSSYSGANGCVEFALVTNGVAVRDSKDPNGPVLLFSPGEWEAFLAGARHGEFDFSS
jgi:hypothetical protein